MLPSQENVYLTTLHALNMSNESQKARFHTGFHRFKEIGQIVHNKYIFLIQKTLSKLKSGRWCGHFVLQFLRLHREENGTSQYRF